MDDLTNLPADAYIEAKFAELRAAITSLNDDAIIRVIDHVRDEAGHTAAHHLVSELLRAAHNRITDPVSAECITTALARYGPDDTNRCCQSDVG
ncbi:hypothetical protein [Haloechinothrix salitolerans]|uniref:Uncharacterized protein n=1 Tax=Haloechinothrix salitolerans TaxID=926830 RepID=A0ABW2BVC4_9PSEU